MTNRDVLKKFILETFNITINDDFFLDCIDVYCSDFMECKECPASCSKRGFWNEEFVSNKNTQINDNEETVAFKMNEITW